MKSLTNYSIRKFYKFASWNRAFCLERVLQLRAGNRELIKEKNYFRNHNICSLIHDIRQWKIKSANSKIPIVLGHLSSFNSTCIRSNNWDQILCERSSFRCNYHGPCITTMDYSDVILYGLFDIRCDGVLYHRKWIGSRTTCGCTSGTHRHKW